MKAAFLALMLASCGGGDVATPSVYTWTVGAPDGIPSGPVIDITQGSVNYITKATGPLTGTLSVTFNITAPLTGKGCPGPATASLYFEATNDDWRTDGKRWWATFATVTLDHAGEYTITAPMDGPWTSVMTMTAVKDPQVFADAKANAARVGFTLGNCTGWGHGATGPATLTIKSFT